MKKISKEEISTYTDIQSRIEEWLLVLINKIDVLPYFDFDLKKCEENILSRNTNAKIIPISAKNNENIDKFASWLDNEIIKFKGE